MKKDEVKKNYLFDNKALFALIAPLLVEQLLAVLVGLADSIMVASAGEAAVSGVSLVDSVMVLMINIFSALATGGAVVAGQYIGQKRTDNAHKAANQLVWFVGLSSLVITGIVYIGQNFILHTVFGKIEPDVMQSARIYLLIVAASIPFIALYNAGAAIFRVMGNSKVSMKVSIIMNIINVCGNAVLIYGFHRGTEGVAIPTLVSRMVACIMILVLLAREKGELYLERTLRFRPDKGMIKRILSIGIPNSLENSMFQMGKLIVLSLVSTFGTYAIAANAVGNAVAMFQMLPGTTMSLAMPTVISQSVGARDFDQARYYTKKLIVITYCGLAVMVGLIYFALPVILNAYNLSPEAATAARQILVFHGFSGVLIWPLSFVLPNVFRASGDARFCMVVSIFSMWMFRIVCSYVIGKYMGVGVLGVWIAMVIDWAFRTIVFVWHYFSGKWQRSAI